MKYISKFSILAAFLACTCLVNANKKMDTAISNFVESKALQKAKAGVCVMDLETGKVVASANKDSLFTPASVTKIVTSASALKALSPDYTFKTEVFLNGMVSFGTLDGNLIIKAGLDPTLESRHFIDQYSFISRCITELKYKGINKIKGKIIIDSSIYPEPTIPSKWDDRDIVEEYGAGAHACNYADNLCSIIVDVSGNRATVIDTIPHQRNLRIVNDMTVTPSKKGRWSPGASRRKNSCKLTLRGNIRRQESPVEIFTTTPDPADALRCSLEEALFFEDIVVENKKLKENVMSQPFFVYESPKLKDIVASLLSRSDNMFAEAVLRSIGINEEGVTSRQNAIKNEYKLLEDWGIDTSDQTLYDGSGLSRTNRYCPFFLASVLTKSQQDENIGELFPSLFPKVGMEGTVRKLLKGSPLEGQLVLKSGSMNGVQCYAGYYPLDNPQYAVVMMANKFRCNYDALKKQIEQLFMELFIEKEN